MRLKGAVWYLRLVHGGRASYHNLGAVTRAEAEALAWDKDRERADEEKRTASGKASRDMRLSALLARFEAEELPLRAPNTQRTYRSTIERVREWMNGDGFRAAQNPTMREIDSTVIADYLSWRRVNTRHGGSVGVRVSPRPASLRTIQKERTTLHTIFAFAKRLKLFDANPISKEDVPLVKPDAREPVIPTPEQYEALLRECEPSPMLWLYALALGETGGRCESEVLWLQWTDVDFDGPDGAFLEIVSGRGGHRTKSGKSRFVPMTARLRDAMRHHFARYRFNAERSPWVFHHEFTRRQYKAGARIRSMRRGLLLAAKRAGLPATFHQHDLRHRRVTTWLEAGHAATIVQDAVGHADLRTTMGYKHHKKPALRTLVDEVPQRRELAR